MRLTLLCLVLAAALGWLTAKLNVISLEAPLSEPASATEARVLAPPRADTPIANSVPPLFRAITPPQNATPRQGESFVLVGLAGSAEERIALLRDTADQRAISARAGDRVGAWTLVEVRERCVLLARTSQTREVCV